MMTNGDRKAIIDKYGDIIFISFFDNSLKRVIGYPGQNPQHASDLILETIGGVDYVGVRQKSTYTRDRDNGVTDVNDHLTQFIQYIAVMDEGCENYRIDPFYA